MCAYCHPYGFLLRLNGSKNKSVPFFDIIDLETFGYTFQYFFSGPCGGKIDELCLFNFHCYLLLLLAIILLVRALFYNEGSSRVQLTTVTPGILE